MDMQQEEGAQQLSLKFHMVIFIEMDYPFHIQEQQYNIIAIFSYPSKIGQCQ